MVAKKSKTLKAGYVIGILLLLLIVVLLLQFRSDIPLEKLMEKYAGEQSYFVEIDGQDVHYRDEGEGEPLVLLHGWASSLHTWDGWAEELKEDFRVIRLDLPAFGLTGPREKQKYTTDFYIDFLEDFLDELELEQIHLAGNSLGGGITWAFASHNPDRVGKIILLNAAGYQNIDTENEGRPFIMELAAHDLMQPFLRHITPRFAIRILVKQVYGDEDKVEEEVVQRYHHMVLREGNREVLFKITEDLHERDPHEDLQSLKELNIPALIMWGDLDTWIPPAHAYRFKEDIPDARLIMYEGAGHIPMEEIPEKTAKDARKFLRE